MEGVLKRHEDGSPNFQYKKLVAPRQPTTSSIMPITRSILKKHLEDLFRDECDVALFYFSGHGTENILGGYLVTLDYEKNDPGISMQDILTLANKSKAHEVVIILDCCDSGNFGKIPALDNAGVFLREGISVLTASLADQSSIEVNGGGIFTALVYEALKGGASDVIGHVNVANIYAYVDQILGAWDQRPLIMSHISKLLPIRKCKPQVDLAILRRLPEYFPASNYQYPLDPSYEWDKHDAGPDYQTRDPEHETIFSHFQKYRDAYLLVPVGEDHLYYAAIHSKACKLTALGQFYWNLAHQGKI